MALAFSYLRYLAHRTDRVRCAALARDLEGHGYRLEPYLLDAWMAHRGSHAAIDFPGSVWHGRRAWLNEFPPADAALGDIWFDPVEMMPMVLIPGWDSPVPEERGEWDDEPLAWYALRPVAVWQYQAMLDGGIERTDGSVGSTLPFEPGRELHGGETDRVTDLTLDECDLFEKWVGKWLPSKGVARAAGAWLPERELDEIFPRGIEEWCGWSDEWNGVVLSRETLPLMFDGPDHEAREELGLTLHHTERRPSIGFRTAVVLRHGYDFPRPFNGLQFKSVTMRKRPERIDYSGK